MSVGRNARWGVLLALLTTLIFSGCGYHRAGRSVALPPDVKTLAVKPFVNKTHTYHVETGLTAAVVRELNTRTHYRIVSSPTDADAVLEATVTTAQMAPVTYNSQTGRATSGLVTIIVNVKLVARDGRVLYSDANHLFRDQYQISNEMASFFEEQGPAEERLERDFARTLVSNLLEAF